MKRGANLIISHDFRFRNDNNLILSHSLEHVLKTIKSRENLTVPHNLQTTRLFLMVLELQRVATNLFFTVSNLVSKLCKITITLLFITITNLVSKHKKWQQPYSSCYKWVVWMRQKRKSLPYYRIISSWWNKIKY